MWRIGRRRTTETTDEVETSIVRRRRLRVTCRRPTMVDPRNLLRLRLIAESVVASIHSAISVSLAVTVSTRAFTGTETSSRRRLTAAAAAAVVVQFSRSIVTVSSDAKTSLPLEGCSPGEEMGQQQQQQS